MQLLVVRADPELDPWFKTPASTGRKFNVADPIHPHDPVMILLALTDIGRLPGGKGNVTIDLARRSATGETDVLGEALPGWDEQVPAPGVVVLAAARAEIAFSDEESPGTITFLADAHDKASGTTVHRELAVTLEPWSYGTVPADAEACGQWLRSYYRTPQPGQAVRAWLEYAQVNDPETDRLEHGVLGFYRAIFASNPKLVDRLVEQVDEADAVQIGKLVIMLHLLGQSARIEELPLGSAEARESTRAKVEAMQLPDPYDADIAAPDLDLLWGEFLATGRYAPVRQIVRALDLARFEPAIAKYEKSRKTEADTTALWKGATFQAARWSLGSNMEQHPLVLDYCLYMAEQEKLAKDERAQLLLLLEEHAPGRLPNKRR